MLEQGDFFFVSRTFSMDSYLNILSHTTMTGINTVNHCVHILMPVSHNLIYHFN
jgi:hypothetical protein